jgi:hypothetical protein
MTNDKAWEAVGKEIDRRLAGYPAEDKRLLLSSALNLRASSRALAAKSPSFSGLVDLILSAKIVRYSAALLKGIFKSVRLILPSIKPVQRFIKAMLNGGISPLFLSKGIISKIIHFIKRKSQKQEGQQWQK